MAWLAGFVLFCFSSLIANGDLISPASRLLIPRKTLNQWDHVLQMVTEKVTLRSGAVHRYAKVIFPGGMGFRSVQENPTMLRSHWSPVWLQSLCF